MPQRHVLKTNLTKRRFKAPKRVLRAMRAGANDGRMKKPGKQIDPDTPAGIRFRGRYAWQIRWALCARNQRCRAGTRRRPRLPERQSGKWVTASAGEDHPRGEICCREIDGLQRSNDLTVRPTSKLTPVRRPSPSLVLPRRRATRCRARRRCEPSGGSASWPGGRRCNQAGDRSQSRRR